jgi:hypothetical protein
MPADDGRRSGFRQPIAQIRAPSIHNATLPAGKTGRRKRSRLVQALHPRAKLWLADRSAGVFGWIYPFDSEADADRSRSTSLFTGMAADPTFADLSIRSSTH